MPEFFYKHSYDTAYRNDDVLLWKESHRENIRCKHEIEKAIYLFFDGKTLGEHVAEQLCAEFGIDRVGTVLAVTIRAKENESHFKLENTMWAKWDIAIIKDERNNEFIVNSHPEALNALTEQYRRYLSEELGIMTNKHCIPNSHTKDYTGKLLILRIDTLDEPCKNGKYQLFVAENGFGCSPNSGGRTIFGKFLYDGESAVYERYDFLGIADQNKIPEWAKEKWICKEEL